MSWVIDKYLVKFTIVNVPYVIGKRFSQNIKYNIAVLNFFQWYDVNSYTVNAKLIGTFQNVQIAFS